MTHPCICIDGPVMPKVEGEFFRCPCLCNVFHAEHDDRRGCLLVCNACGREYKGERA